MCTTKVYYDDNHDDHYHEHAEHHSNTDKETFTVNLNLGYSDTTLIYKIKKFNEGPDYKIQKTFYRKNIEKFQHLIHKENWKVVTISDEPNTSFNTFMDTFKYYFNIAFPLKIIHEKTLLKIHGLPKA